MSLAYFGNPLAIGTYANIDPRFRKILRVQSPSPGLRFDRGPYRRTSAMRLQYTYLLESSCNYLAQLVCFRL
jgi:hypothetical protein